MKLLNSFTKITYGIALSVVISAAFLQQLLFFVKGFIPDPFFERLVLCAFIPLLIGIYYILTQKTKCFLNALILTIVLIAGIVFSQFIPIFVERIHLFEYGLLGWFAARDLTHHSRQDVSPYNRLSKYGYAFVFGTLVGIIDECFQGVLPYRHFSIHDILLNSGGSLWGIVLFYFAR